MWAGEETLLLEHVSLAIRPRKKGMECEDAKVDDQRRRDQVDLQGRASEMRDEMTT